MNKEQTKSLIADQVAVISDEIRDLENIPSQSEANKIIWQLYQVMRQLSDFSEGGY